MKVSLIGNSGIGKLALAITSSHMPMILPSFNEPELKDIIIPESLLNKTVEYNLPRTSSELKEFKTRAKNRKLRKKKRHQ